MEIRRAIPQDAKILFRCAVESYADYILLIERTPGPLLEDYYEGILSHHCFVAESDGGIDGFILLKEGKEGIMWLEAVASDPKSRGQGVGKALILFAEDYMKGLGMQECHLYTHVKYERSLAIYDHLGYVIYNRVQENGYDRYYLKKSLRTQKNHA